MNARFFVEMAFRAVKMGILRPEMTSSFQAIKTNSADDKTLVLNLAIQRPGLMVREILLPDQQLTIPLVTQRQSGENFGLTKLSERTGIGDGGGVHRSSKTQRPSSLITLMFCSSPSLILSFK